MWDVYSIEQSHEGPRANKLGRTGSHTLIYAVLVQIIHRTSQISNQ